MTKMYFVIDESSGAALAATMFKSHAKELTKSYTAIILEATSILGIDVGMKLINACISEKYLWDRYSNQTDPRTKQTLFNMWNLKRTEIADLKEELLKLAETV